MATYVNLSVNQGLIDKAKAVQNANRNTLAKKQQKAKSTKQQKEDAPRRSQILYTPRKRAASDDGPFIIGSFRSISLPTEGDKFYDYLRVWDSEPFNTDSWNPATDPFGDDSLDISFNRIFLSGDGQESISDDSCSIATRRPFPFTRRQFYNTYEPLGRAQLVFSTLDSYMRVFPVGGDTAIVVAQIWLREAYNLQENVPVSENRFDERINQGAIAFVVSGTDIRELPSIPNTVLYPNPYISGTTPPASGPTWAAKFNPRIVFDSAGNVLRSPAPSPPPFLWTPDIYLNNTGLRDEIEPEIFLSWDTIDGELFDGTNEWLMHFYETPKDGASREPVSPAVEHPNPNYKTIPTTRWDQFLTDDRLRTRSNYHLAWENSTAIPVAQNRPQPKVYPNSNLFFVESAPPGEAQNQRHTFWDWNAPQYCREEALSLGFTEDDLEP
jgi:hypothetical protein